MNKKPKKRWARGIIKTEVNCQDNWNGQMEIDIPIDYSRFIRRLENQQNREHGRDR